MSLNGLVHPNRTKCESANWRWVRAAQLAPQGLGPVLDQERQCDYGDIAPYKSQQVLNDIANTMPFRIWGYPNVTSCSKLSPLLYAPRVDPKPPVPCSERGQCKCGRDQQWPYGFYCGQH